jgi:uncharacterized OsmC-like protein
MMDPTPPAGRVATEHFSAGNQSAEAAERALFALACKALTVLLYAKRKKFPVEGIEVSVERDASQEHAGIYRLSTALTLTGDLSTAQREELVHVAHKCPIQRLMTEVTTEISTTLSWCAIA